MTALLVLGLLALMFGLAVDVVFGYRWDHAWLTWALVGLGSLVLVIAGAWGVGGSGAHLSMQGVLGDEGGSLVVDPLSALFLLIVFGAALPGLMVIVGWDGQRSDGCPRTLPAAISLLLLSSALIVLAGNVFVLMVGWELLTASFFWLSAVERTREGRVPAGVLAVSFGKFSGAALLSGTLLLAAHAGSLDLADLGLGPSSSVRAVGYTAMLLAFAVKVGLVPVQVWMPASYSSAPGPARALMAGAAVNVGFYGMWRTLDILGQPPTWLAITVLLLGAVTALLGVAHASVQGQLTRVVAYSSVENAGLITTAYGVALVGSVEHSPRLMAAGLLAATLQVIAHAVAKTLMFASAGVIESQLGSDELDELRGVSRVLPWSGTGLAIGSVTMAGLPPAALFVSEWFILESLMQQFRLHALYLALPMATAGALVALTAGFAGVAFARLAAFTALGRTAVPTPDANDVNVVGRAGLLLLMTACLVLAVMTPWEIKVIAQSLSGLVPAATTRGALSPNWVVGPVFDGFSALSPTTLVLVLPAMLLITILLTALLTRNSFLRIRRVEPWRSATGGVEGADEYTPFGFANPTRTVLANLLLTRTELRRIEPSARDGAARPSNGPRTEPEMQTTANLTWSSDVLEVTEYVLYRPLARILRAGVRTALRLQSGRLDAYLFYMLIALLALITIVTAIG